MLSVNTRSARVSRPPTPHAKARIDVRFEVDPRPEHSRERLRRTIRTALDRAIGKVVNPQRTLAVDVLVTGDDEIRRLNADHRGIDRATDVLSFPQLSPDEARPLWGVAPPKCFLCAPGGTSGRPSQAKPDRPDGLALGEPVHLGDIVVSLPMIRRQSARRDTTPEEELEFVVAHALLHLLGCDHNTPARRRAMWECTHLLLWNGT